VDAAKGEEKAGETQATKGQKALNCLQVRLGLAQPSRRKDLANMLDIATGLDYLTKIVGVGGGILGGWAFINTRRMKALDLRVQLRNQQHDLRVFVDDLKSLMERAAQSRTNISAAIGLGQSDAMQLWNQRYEKDLMELETVENLVSRLLERYANVSFDVLENRMVALHELSSRATRFKAGYDASLAEDEGLR
jgi:hypothetical protein